jgi:hypothetical protein
VLIQNEKNEKKNPKPATSVSITAHPVSWYFSRSRLRRYQVDATGLMTTG